MLDTLQGIVCIFLFVELIIMEYPVIEGMTGYSKVIEKFSSDVELVTERVFIVVLPKYFRELISYPGMEACNNLDTSIFPFLIHPLPLFSSPIRQLYR